MNNAQMQMIRMSAKAMKQKPAGKCQDCLWSKACQRIERKTTGEGCHIFSERKADMETTKKQATKSEAFRAYRVLKDFASPAQRSVLSAGCHGEEKQFFFDKLCELADRINSMPRTYEQDGLGKKAIAYLHYFAGGSDWWITEKDMGTPDDPGQHQAFGMVKLLGYEAELGYISIAELLENGVELDLHFEPRTLEKIERKA